MAWVFLLLQESIFIHSSLQDLHEHVDPAILPEEFGGSAGPFDNALIREAVERFGDYFQEVIDAMNREKLRTS